MSPLRDPLGFDGSPKPVAGSSGSLLLLLRRLLPGFDLWWNWRQSKRVPTPELGDAAQQRKPDQQ